MNPNPAPGMNIPNKHTPKSLIFIKNIYLLYKLVVKPSIQMMKRKQTIQRLRPKNPPTPKTKNLSPPNKRPQTQQKQRTEKLDNEFNNKNKYIK